MKYFYFLIGFCFLFNNNQLSYNNEDKSNFNCPDLIISELTVDDFSANSVAYSFVIKNIGTVAANLDGPTAAQSDNVSIQAFLSADTIFYNSGDIGAGGSILGVSPLGNLGPGATFSGNFGASASVNTQTHPYLIIKIDWGEKVEECNESNNTFYVLIEEVETSCPDLIVSELMVDK